MEYSTMSLVDLKQAAKTHVPPIKHYYIKTRAELIEILSMVELPKALILEKLRIQDLRREARVRGLPNIWRMRRDRLIELLYPDAEQDNENDNNTQKHDPPQEGEGEKVGV